MTQKIREVEEKQVQDVWTEIGQDPAPVWIRTSREATLFFSRLTWTLEGCSEFYTFQKTPEKKEKDMSNLDVLC